MKTGIGRAQVNHFLDSLPDNAKVILKQDGMTVLTPEQVKEHIADKTEIGKKFYLQIVKILLKDKDKAKKEVSVIDTN